MRPTRRAVLGGLLGGAAALAAPRRARAEEPRPHYMVLVMLSGGVDSILTVDPKDARTVLGKIDCGYPADQLLRGERRVYGPLFAPLMPHESSLAILHGVRIDTVGHDEAHFSISRGRIGASVSHPLIADVIGASLPGSAPLPHLAIQDAKANTDPVDLLGPTSTAVRISPRSMQQLLRQHPAHGVASDLLTRSREVEGKAVLAAHAPTADLYLASAERTLHLRRLIADLPADNPFFDPQLGIGLHLALHGIEHDRARFFTVGANLGWFDSHTDNLHIQSQRVVPALRDVARLLTLLGERRNAHGSLLSQTTVVIGSELGRYPRENLVHGKDHWPENSWILAGRGVRPGVTIGATDARFQGMKVDHESGSTTTGNRRPLYLDTLFATLLHLAGGDPRLHGYDRDALLRPLLLG